MNGKSGVFAEMAVRFKAFGSSPETWLRMQMQYDLAHIREEEILVTRYDDAWKATTPWRMNTPENEPWRWRSRSRVYSRATPRYVKEQPGSADCWPPERKQPPKRGRATDSPKPAHAERKSWQPERDSPRQKQPDAHNRRSGGTLYLTENRIPGYMRVHGKEGAGNERSTQLLCLLRAIGRTWQDLWLSHRGWGSPLAVYPLLFIRHEIRRDPDATAGRAWTCPRKELRNSKGTKQKAK